MSHKVVLVEGGGGWGRGYISRATPLQAYSPPPTRTHHSFRSATQFLFYFCVLLATLQTGHVTALSERRLLDGIVATSALPGQVLQVLTIPHVHTVFCSILYLCIYDFFKLYSVEKMCR